MRLRITVIPRVGAVVPLASEEEHHARAVLRRDDGDAVDLLAPDGSRWRGTLAPGGVEVSGREESEGADPAVDLEIWLPWLKGGRSDDLVRQLTELGARRLTVFASARSVARGEGKLPRWAGIAAQATKQCGRSLPPTVAWSPALPASGPGVFLWERPGALARSVLEAWREPRLTLLVGPEGGLAAEEARHLEDLGWVPGWLGPRILRAETAAIAGAVLALHRLREGGY